MVVPEAVHSLFNGQRLRGPLSFLVPILSALILSKAAFGQTSGPVPAYVFSSPLLPIIQSLPEGGWAKVNLNRYQDVWTPQDLRPQPWGQFPDQIIRVWSGYAWDSNRGDLILYGGGHGNYSGNDVYRWHSTTLSWERASLPSEVALFPDGGVAYLAVDGADAAPSSAHTYQNNIFLPIVDRFMTWGGAMFNTGDFYVKPNESNPTQLRPTGPYLFDPSKADGNKVGGTTGSHVQAVAPHPEVVGGHMWQNRDLFKNLAGQAQPLHHTDSCTAYAQENGHDVIYMGAPAASGTQVDLFRYELVDLNLPTIDSIRQVGIFWTGTAGQTTCGYDPTKKLFVRTGNNSVPLLFWDLNVAGPNNKDQRVDVTGSVLSFQNWLTANSVNLQFCSLAFDPVRGQYLIWCGTGTVWSVQSPSANTTYNWIAAQQPAPTTPVPPGTVNTGILGKWRYAPYYDVFIGLQDPFNGDIWVYKPLGWEAPNGAPPSVSLIVPAPGAVVVQGATVSVSARVSSPVAKVEFFANGSSIGVVTTGTGGVYSLAWTPAQAGNYALTAKATNSSGASGTSAAVNVVVDAPPTSSITAPAPGGVVALGAAVTVAATASDPDGTVAKVEFFANGSSIGVVTTGTGGVYSLPWTPAQAGSYSLTARPTDNRGVFSSSGPVTVQVQATAPGTVSVVLQQGQNGYLGTSDVTLDSFSPTTNWGSNPSLWLQGNSYTSLIRFGIFASEGGPVPNGATIQSATLQIYKDSYNYIYELHPMLKPWNQSQATWQVSSAGVPWSVAGAHGVGSDYASVADAQFSAGFDPGWMTFDVSNRVAQYAAGSANYGWSLIGLSGNSNLRYFRSSEYVTNQTLRPTLTIRYSVSLPPVVSSLSVAPASTIALGNSITVSATASAPGGTVAKVEFFANGSSIGVDTTGTGGVYSLPWTPAQAGNYALTAKATNSSGASGTSAAVTVQVQATAPGTVSVVLQQGQNGYLGTSDVTLDSFSPTTNWGSNPSLWLQGNSYTSLIRFGIFASEGGPVPNGATIQSATLQIYKDSYNYIYELHPMLKPWNQSQATWQVSSAGVPWSVAGAHGVGSDYASVADAQFSAGFDPGWMTFDVSNRVAQYAAGSANYGWSLIGLSGNSNLRYFRSSEYVTNQTLRPTLTIRYTLPSSG